MTIFMIDAVHQGKNPTCVVCFGIGNLPNFAVVKSLHKFGGFLVWCVFPANISNIYRRHF